MSRRLRILVADDERDTREYLQEFLAHLGHEVRAAQDGGRLIEMSRDFAPDVVVTDYAMPGMDGLAAAAEINRERAVPVILISGRHGAEEAARAAGNLVVRFLMKPFKEADLRATIDSVTATARPSDGHDGR
jgi:CheY-like chemotaxis protein